MEPGDDWRLTERIRASARSGKGDPFAAAVRATRMAMIITDPCQIDNPIIYANDAFLRLTGYTRLEVMGRNCRFLQGPGTDLATVARLRAAIRSEQDVSAEVLNYRKDGSTFHNALYISPVHDEDGTLLFFFASQLDVCERHALAEERDRTRAALDANALLLREIGHRTRNDLQMISAMLSLQSRNSADPAVRAALDEAIAAERDVKSELLNYRKDGSTFHNAVFISPVHDEDGTLLFFFASQLDVSERYALAQERDRTRAALETNDLLLREVGHRARNDLQMIAAMLALQSSNSGDPAVRAALGEAIGRIEALGALYREPVHPQEGAGHDLADLLREIADTLVAASGRANVTLAFDLVPLRIRPDAAAPLALILNEVLSAILKHADPAQAQHLTLRVAREAEAVLVEVEEDGSGTALEADGFATTLVDALTRQVDGTCQLRERQPSGSVIAFRFNAARVAA